MQRIDCGTQRYRSGHNEAVLKTVCPQGRVGSNPTLCAFFCPKTWLQKKIKIIQICCWQALIIVIDLSSWLEREQQVELRTLITEQWKPWTRINSKEFFFEKFFQVNSFVHMNKTFLNSRFELESKRQQWQTFKHESLILAQDERWRRA